MLTTICRGSTGGGESALHELEGEQFKWKGAGLKLEGMR